MAEADFLVDPFDGTVVHVPAALLDQAPGLAARGAQPGLVKELERRDAGVHVLSRFDEARDVLGPAVKEKRTQMPSQVLMNLTDKVKQAASADPNAKK